MIEFIKQQLKKSIANSRGVIVHFVWIAVFIFLVAQLLTKVENSFNKVLHSFTTNESIYIFLSFVVLSLMILSFAILVLLFLKYVVKQYGKIKSSSLDNNNDSN
jgi:uncharacterized BrkB/YihY/UPF0761 family membrane protein